MKVLIAPATGFIHRHDVRFGQGTNKAPGTVVECSCGALAISKRRWIATRVYACEWRGLSRRKFVRMVRSKYERSA